MSEPVLEERLFDPIKDELTRVKGAGEGAQVAVNPFEGGSSSSFAPVGGDTFGSLYANRKTTPQTTVEGSTAAPEGAPATGVAPKASGGLTTGVAGFAKQFVGTPYKWGGNGPLGFDCSGFTKYVLGQFGINLPRVSYQQGQGGFAVGKGDLQPGDLIFWDNSTRNNGADHVAIYIGNGQIIEALKPGTAVQVRKLGNFGWARRYTSGGQPTAGRNRAA